MAHTHDSNHDELTAVGRAFAVGIALNVGFVIVEALYGWRAASLALLADAFHNLSDVGGLLLSWAGVAAARLTPSDRHTYGWRRGSILASFGNAVLLLVAMGSLAWGMATSETALTAHLVIDGPQQDRDTLLRAATHALEERFKIRHVTFQLESTDCPSDGRCG